MVTLYEIETERLLLRQWREGDWVGLHRAYGDSEVMSWIGAASRLAARGTEDRGRLDAPTLRVGPRVTPRKGRGRASRSVSMCSIFLRSSA